MRYPELDIGEFASKHSANVELKKQEGEEGYPLTVDVEPQGGEGYPVSISAKPQTVEEVVELYEDQFADFPTDGLVAVYGSDDSAAQSMSDTDSWARFQAPKKNDVEDSDELKGWAVDVKPLVRGMEEDQYKEIMDEISASTLYVVNRAESEGEVGAGLEDFHRDITREFTPDESGPVVIDVAEDAESDNEYVDLDEEKTAESSEEAEMLPESEVVEASDELEETESETQFDYEELVSGTISESKSRIEELEDELEEDDWEALLDAEREGEDRVTFKPYIEARLEEEREHT